MQRTKDIQTSFKRIQRNNMFWLNWFLKNENEVIKKNIMHGVDLDKYHYVGHSQPKYVVEEPREITSFANVFYFVSKTNNRDKIFVIPPKQNSARGHDFRYHSYVLVDVGLWKSGEKEIYYSVSDPSNWLIDYMFGKYNVVWNEKDNWWSSAQNSNQNKNKNKVLKTKTETNANNKVITVDFGKKD